MDFEELNEFGFRGIEPKDLLGHVVGNKEGPFELSGLPFQNNDLRCSPELRERFVVKQKAFGATMLKVMFSAEDSVARTPVLLPSGNGVLEIF